MDMQSDQSYLEEASWKSVTTIVKLKTKRYHRGYTQGCQKD